MPTPPKPRETLLSYIRIQGKYDRQLYTLLRAAAADADLYVRQIVGEGIGAQIRRDQMDAVRKALHLRLTKLARDVGLTVVAGQEEAAAEAIKTFGTYEAMLLTTRFTEKEIKQYLKAAEVQARAGISAAEQRLLGASYRPLSDQVYKTLALESGQVDRYVNSALARGLSAREFAKGVKDLIAPNVRGGVSYAAMRLGRTEINNAFHATSAQRARDVPWIEGVVWRLSGSHPVTDVCNSYAEEDDGVEGHPAGFYTPDDIPAKPHPHCLCYTTPVLVPDDVWLTNLINGDYDRYLSEVTGIDYVDAA